MLLVARLNLFSCHPFFSCLIDNKLIYSAMRKPGPDVHMLNRTIYAVGLGDNFLSRTAIDDPEDSRSMTLKFTPSRIIADPVTRVFYFVDPQKTSIYRMPLAFATRNSK